MSEVQSITVKSQRKDFTVEEPVKVSVEVDTSCGVKAVKLSSPEPLCAYEVEVILREEIAAAIEQAKQLPPKDPQQTTLEGEGKNKKEGGGK